MNITPAHLAMCMESATLKHIEDFGLKGSYTVGTPIGDSAFYDPTDGEVLICISSSHVKNGEEVSEFAVYSIRGDRVTNLGDDPIVPERYVTVPGKVFREACTIATDY